MLYLDATSLAARLSPKALIDALDRAFRSDIHMPARQSYAVGGPNNAAAALFIMPAWQTNAFIGVKLVTVFPNNSTCGEPAVHATYTLFDAATGAPRAMLDGTELTLRRTAAASALAARYLAHPEAATLLMVGTGSLAPHVIECHAAVRPIRHVRVWGRRPERARAVAKSLAGKPYEIEAVEDLRSAVTWADIVSSATLAAEPLLHGAWLRPGQHFDLIGSFTPQMREADDEVMVRSAIYVDTRAGALAESGELVHALAAGLISTANIRGELSELARASVTGRRDRGEITLFKSVGCALEDLAAAELAVTGENPP